MPFAFKKPCRYPGCAELTHDSYCDAHKKQVNHDYEKYKRNPDTARLYDSRWRKIRAQYIALHPVCEMCDRAGRLTPATEIHHIKELHMGGTHDDSNLQALCKACHSAVGENWKH